MQVAMASRLVALPLTISSKRMTFAGLKKCVPMTNSGRAVLEAISSMLKVEVLLAKMAPGLQTRSSSLKTSFFERHAFEDGFDHEVHARKSVEASGRFTSNSWMIVVVNQPLASMIF